MQQDTTCRLQRGRFCSQGIIMTSLAYMALWVGVTSTLICCIHPPLAFFVGHGDSLTWGADHDAGGLDLSCKLQATQSILTFLMGLGEVSCVSLHQTAPKPLTCTMDGGTSGATLMLVSAPSMAALKRLESDDAKTAVRIGDTRTICTIIPANRRNAGLLHIYDHKTKQIRQNSGLTNSRRILMRTLMLLCSLLLTTSSW